MTEKEKAQQFASKAPPLNQAERDAINALFPAYIFRRSCTDEIWTTCCHKHMTVTNADMMVSTPERNFLEVMMLTHQREPKNRWDDPPKSEVLCPLCGKQAIVKELRYTGNRDNLSRYRRAAVLRWHDGALWARVYDCGKHYRKEKYSLTGEPECKLVGVYRFRPGLAEATTRPFWDDYPFSQIVCQDGPLKKGRWNIHSPFSANAEYGIGYDVIGLDEVQKSPFRYCMVAEAAQNFSKLLEFLTACCFYPRQIEMLMKAGMMDVVRDFVERGVRHAAVIKWEEPNPLKGFGLSRQDMKTFLSTNRDIGILELFKRLKGSIPLAECADLIAYRLNIKETFQAANRWNVAPEKLMRYLRGNVGCARYGGLSNLDSALRYWNDYLIAAQEMGYQIHRDNVLLPKRLGEAHDEATARHRERLEQERIAAQQERERTQKAEQAEQKRLEAMPYEERRAYLENKYSFSMDGYIIRVPASKDEILNEGVKLKHCVGGYADRHMAGAVVILFMRKEKKPDEPWLTIEMSKNRLVQIHGYRNEGTFSAKGRFAPDPREIYRGFLDTWLDWLKKGSKRDEHGQPKLPKTRKGVAA